MPVNAIGVVRKMRGGAQSHLLAADDGHFYVVKFRNNPQHRRILINEWMATAVLRHLNIQTAPAAIVALDQAFIEAHPELCLQLGTRRVPPEPGWHYGSRFPGHPERTAVYDYLPDSLLATLDNRMDFLGALVADRWLGNSDARQAIFFRAESRELDLAGVHPRRKVFLAQMIDHGFVFNGPMWDFPDSPLQGLYFRHSVYAGVQGLASFEPWLGQVESFPVEVLDRAWRSLPPAWLEGEDETAGERMIEILLRRRTEVARYLEQVRRARVGPFPAWKSEQPPSWPARVNP